MSRPIKLTDELRKQALEEFTLAMEKIKMADGKINYNKSFTYKGEEKAVIVFTPSAYTKMLSLLNSFDSEVAWHGVGHRVKDSKFMITDILVYPQTVTGSNVEMDTEEYTKWLINNCDDDRFNHIMMQGHSHVGFSTNPSQVDLKHQEDILDQLTDDMFYIFMIWNKKLEHNTKIYDLENNTLYENKDITYLIADENLDIEEFIKNSKKIVKAKTAATKYLGSTYTGGTSATTEKTKKKDKNIQEPTTYGGGYKGRGFDFSEDYAAGYYFN